MFTLVFHSNVNQKIRTQIRANLDFVETKLNLFFKNSITPDVDFYFSYDKRPQSNITITGETYESNVIIGKIFKQSFNQSEFMIFLFHELNHIYRNNLFSTEKEPSLFNWMLLEGLAQAFEKQVAKRLDFDWHDFYIKPNCHQAQLIQGLREIIKITSSNLAWNHYDWFYNNDRQAKMPVNFAYNIGEFLVTEYCRKNQLQPSEALSHTNQKFWDYAQELSHA